MITDRKEKTYNSAFVLGVRIDKVTLQEAVDICKKLIKSNTGHYVVTPNPEIIVAAHKNSQFKEILNGSDLSIPDGVGIVWLSKIFGNSTPERVSGIDLLESLVQVAAENGLGIFLLGGREGVAEKASKVLKNRYPNLKIVGTFAGDGERSGDREVLKKIGQDHIDILAVAYGPGKQERWIKRNLEKINVKLAISVGGSLDFISGEKRRSPKWVQNIGLEWLFRLVNEPSRWKRQLALPVFVSLFFIEKLSKGKFR